MGEKVHMSTIIIIYDGWFFVIFAKISKWFGAFYDTSKKFEQLFLTENWREKRHFFAKIAKIWREKVASPSSCLNDVGTCCLTLISTWWFLHFWKSCWKSCKKLQHPSYRALNAYFIEKKVAKSCSFFRGSSCKL